MLIWNKSTLQWLKF